MKIKCIIKISRKIKEINFFKKLIKKYKTFDDLLSS